MASTILLIAAFGLPSLIALLGAPPWMGFLLGAAFYILLILLTYQRLRDAPFSSGWIVLMIFSFNVGPAWNGIQLGFLLNLVPVIVAGIAPAKPEIERLAT
ncbi:hypothetical protein HZF05_01215 [Sphingomonas sp. CGMCC 1.13654]|uniref:Uncharacterized protein n=1 Tax=Sphingomonas chungangi TaxID=2683589 RepID=A0A838KZM1_9SPHN|nr:hypothetical protein [Sphingomonas chungangi]